MLYSNERKLCLSGWLQKNNNVAYCSSLRIQKFLFFYEVFSKIDQDIYDFSHLKGYQRGPVFSQVWGDYAKDRGEFDEVSLNVYISSENQINESRANRASFIVSTLSESELSNLTHKFHIWNKKQDRIMSGEQQVMLADEDFDQSDFSLGKILEQMYPEDMVRNSTIIPIYDKYFVLPYDEKNKLTEQHLEALTVLARHPELHNPVYIEIDAEGRLCVD